MSFITINDRAGRIGERASVAGLFGVTEALFYVRTAARKAQPLRQAGVMTIVALGLIFVLSSGVLALAFLRSMPPAQSQPRITVQLHPTCSPDRDCFVARPPVTRVEVERNPYGTLERNAKFEAAREDSEQNRSLVASPGEAQAFGSIAAPTTRWSGAATAQRAGDALPAMVKQAPAAKSATASKAPPAAKQAKLQKAAQASKKG